MVGPYPFAGSAHGTRLWPVGQVAEPGSGHQTPMDSDARTRSRRRSGGLSALLPGLLVLAVLATGAGGGSPDDASSTERAPVVDLTVRSGSR